MIEKTLEAVCKPLGDISRAKSYKYAYSSLPEILASMSNDEEILWVSATAVGGMLLKNSGRESVTNVVFLLTSKKFYYTGVDGKSSIFFQQPKSGKVDIKDIHALGVGSEALSGPTLTFEVKNEDYKIKFGNIDISFVYKVQGIFDEAISKTQGNDANQDNTVIQAALSPADEIKKFKELLDMGVITQEEFDAKKKQLLGL